MDKQLIAHELWAAAQLAPGEGIADGAQRIADILARIDAERGKSAAGILCISHFRNCPEMENAEFQPLRSFAPGQYPLFLSPTIPEGMALVPPEKPLPDLMMASYHEAVGWNACRNAMLIAQGERNVAN